MTTKQAIAWCAKNRARAEWALDMVSVWRYKPRTGETEQVWSSTFEAAVAKLARRRRRKP